MENYFLVLMLIALVCLVAGLIHPSNFQKLFGKIPSRKLVSLVFGGIVIAAFVTFGLLSDTPSSSYNTTTTPKIEEKKVETTADKKEETKTEALKSEPDVPQYEIVYTVTNKRFDGGINYYVLIPSINLSNAKFKDDIKEIVRDIVKQKGGKISVDIFDDREALNIMYHQYGDMTLNRTRTTAEDALVAQHSIASFSGELSTDFYSNTLHFFISAESSTPKVGKYVETIEFNP